MKRTGMPVAIGLVVGISLMVLVPITILFFAQRSIISAEAFARQEAQLINQAISEYSTIEASYQHVLSKTRSDLVFARYLLEQRGAVELNDDATISVTAMNQITGVTTDVSIPRMEVAGAQVAFDYGIVDEIQSNVGGTATIFQMIPRGMLRISTNVLKLDGTRAVGTYIPTESPVYRTVASGETFYGRAFVVNAWYITAYEPIFTDSGEVIGCLYVGVQEAPYQQELLDTMAEVKIGESGYVFVLNAEGEYVLSLDRLRDGENIVDAQDADGNSFIRDMIATARVLAPRETAIQYYPWQNAGESAPRDKIASIAYFEPWEWTIGISAYRDDVLTGVRDTSRAILLIAVAFAVVGVVVAIVLARSVSRPLRIITGTIGSMSKGDLTTLAGYRSFLAEFNALRDTLENVLLANLRRTLQEVQRTSIEGQELSAELNQDTRQAASASADISAAAGRIQAELTQLADKIKAAEHSIQEINGGITSLDSRLENQTVAVTESSSSIEEMTASIQNVATIAQRESGASRDLVERIAEGESALTETGESIANLEKQFETVQDTLTVIDSIAANTNLLAMNAAIEAAHAGDAGRGFAVVAEEIRNLAASTGENAKKISSTIDNMVDRIQQTIESSRQSTGVFESISEQTERFVEAFSEIAQATVEASSGTEETLKGVLDLQNSAQRIKETSGDIQRNADQVQSSVTDISATIVQAVNDYGGIERGFAEVEESQKEIETLSERNTRLSTNLMEQIEFFKILCEEEEVAEGCVDD